MYGLSFLNSFVLPDHIEYKNQALAMKKLSGAFFLLIYGLSIGIFVFMVELIWCNTKLILIRTWNHSANDNNI